MLKGKGWVMLHSAMVLLFWLLLGTTYWPAKTSAVQAVPVSNMNSRGSCGFASRNQSDFADACNQQLQGCLLT